MKNCSVLAEALQEVVEQNIFEYIQQIDMDEEYIFSPKFEKKMQKLIASRKKSYFNLVCTTSRKIACIMVACTVLGIGTLNADALGQFCDFIVRHFAFHDEIILESSSDLTTTIEKEYVLGNIPKGFVLKDYQKEDGSIYYSYKDSKNGFIIFFQHSKDNYICRFDTTRSTQSEFIDDDGTKYLIYTIDSGKTDNADHAVIWQNEEYVFEIYSNLSEKEMINLSKSLTEKQ